MINLLKEFKQAIIENVYVNSVFDYNIYKPADLQICHILSNSEATKKAIMKAYDCDKTIATLLTDMPLLNTVVGTREDNAYYKKTDDIVYINEKLIKLVNSEIISKIRYIDIKNLMTIKVFRDYFYFLQNKYFISEYAVLDIKEIQYRFHRETKIHF